MDQSKDILELSQTFKIDLDHVPYIGKSSEKKKVARRRWAILAKALKSPSGSQPSSPTDEISVRRISSFMLLETRELLGPPIEHVTDQISKRSWFEYSITIDQRVFKLNIGHRNRTFSAEDLMGFNNTGNVCIWPSEETLSYYVCLNLDIFANKSVLELGGGMSCLAGLFVAKYSTAKEVLVTDGNKTSMENVEAILQCNSFACNADCTVLKWGEPNNSYNKFDVIISADCLFFDDARLDFVNCLHHYLAPKGFALVMAPQRGATLDSFICQSESRGLVCKKVMNYSDVVWQKRADYWKSQDRKYCDFCKCWIADNKPSRDFHENGRRHKENVKKRLRNISRESAKSFRETEKVDATIKAMEAAALDAYQRDVAQNSTADLTSIAINKKLSDDNLQIATRKVWHELVGRDGKSYYWNTITNETIWSPPAEGYMTIMEQKFAKSQEIAKQYREVERFNKKEERLRLQAKEQEEAEERARLAREKLKERRVKEDTPPPTYGPILDPGKNDPYGKWQTVKETAPTFDLQLPQQDYYDCPIVVEPEPVVKEFKEKTIESLASLEEESSFKKRKMPSVSKRNMRQRLDDD